MHRSGVQNCVKWCIALLPNAVFFRNENFKGLFLHVHFFVLFCFHVLEMLMLYFVFEIEVYDFCRVLLNYVCAKLCIELAFWFLVFFYIKKIDEKTLDSIIIDSIVYSLSETHHSSRIWHTSTPYLNSVMKYETILYNSNMQNPHLLKF